MDFAERYELGDVLGTGAFGTVRAARDRTTGRAVAVKLLVVPTAEVRARFVREARLLARLRHPNVCPVYDLDESDGQLRLVMEMMRGGSLRARIATVLPHPEVLRIARGCLAGVAALHAAGIVHRDLKPDNVLFGDGDQPVITDLGLARDAGATALTNTGELLGTPRFMAPEQVFGGEITPATDVWAMGVVIYEMFTCRAPFEGRTLPQLFGAIRESEPIALADFGVAPAVSAAIARALAKDPKARFADAAAFARALDGARRRESAPLRAAPAPRAPRRTPLVLAAGALALGLVALGWPRAPAPAPPSRAPASPASIARPPWEAVAARLMAFDARFDELHGRSLRLELELSWRAGPELLAEHRALRAAHEAVRAELDAARAPLAALEGPLCDAALAWHDLLRARSTEREARIGPAALDIPALAQAIAVRPLRADELRALELAHVRLARAKLPEDAPAFAIQLLGTLSVLADEVSRRVERTLRTDRLEPTARDLSDATRRALAPLAVPGAPQAAGAIWASRLAQRRNLRSRTDLFPADAARWARARHGLPERLFAPR